MKNWLTVTVGRWDADSGPDFKLRWTEIGVMSFDPSAVCAAVGWINTADEKPCTTIHLGKTEYNVRESRETIIALIQSALP